MQKTALLMCAALLVTPAFGASEAGISCPATTHAELKSKFAGKGNTKIVFFASWCSSCLPHLKEAAAPNTIYVATFDEQPRAEKVLRSLNVRGACFSSVDIAEKLEVKSLPATKEVIF